MRPETKAILKKIAYYLWDGILGSDNDHTYYPWILLTRNGEEFSIRICPPKDKIDDYRKALNAMRAYNVLTCDVHFDKFKIVDSNTPIASPLGQYDLSQLQTYFVVTKFDTVRFIDFCYKFEIKLQDEAKIHTAQLIIGSNYNPLVIIDGKRYEYGHLYESTMTKLMRIALYRSEEDITIEKIKDFSNNPQLISEAIDGAEFDVRINNGIRTDYYDRKEYPKELEYFFDIKDEFIRGKKEISIDDEDMQILIRGAEKSRKKKRKNTKKKVADKEKDTQTKQKNTNGKKSIVTK